MQREFNCDSKEKDWNLPKSCLNKTKSFDFQCPFHYFIEVYSLTL
jgi:hypothetical protein